MACKWRREILGVLTAFADAVAKGYRPCKSCLPSAAPTTMLTTQKEQP